MDRASALSVAFVNLKPLVPGHVLVTPRRIVPRYDGLTREEALDLWQVSNPHPILTDSL